MNKNTILLYLVALLTLYLGPLYLIYVGGVFFSAFESRFAFVDAVIKFVTTDVRNQELFVRIIMPLLVGLTSGSTLKNITSLPSVVLSITFIVSLATTSLLLIELGTPDVKELLDSRELSVVGLEIFTSNMREALVTSLTITLGISASKRPERKEGQ